MVLTKEEEQLLQQTQEQLEANKAQKPSKKTPNIQAVRWEKVQKVAIGRLFIVSFIVMFFILGLLIGYQTAWENFNNSQPSYNREFVGGL